MPSKIVQIAVSSPYEGSRIHLFFALAEDGTVWKRLEHLSDSSEGKWIQIPALPDGISDEAFNDFVSNPIGG
ncbi:hypothetical protein TKWG_13355 [Advenella kashmirensis WT001]|uniref:Uncharacterized protein n=1 Tax=Advenella kashmirensis (strain DSM 17095 / LMG 22695 / WT001) TaxID=1036672 RepID=I3UCQ1_ADVKW|nr:hypothetical protein TKWG_13355 [Advenella kashmirensis WT001]